VHFIIGLTLTGLCLLAILTWRRLVDLLLRGLIPFLLMFIGLIVMAASCRGGDADAAPAPDPPMPQG